MFCYIFTGWCQIQTASVVPDRFHHEKCPWKSVQESISPTSHRYRSTRFQTGKVLCITRQFMGLDYAFVNWNSDCYGIFGIFKFFSSRVRRSEWQSSSCVARGMSCLAGTISSTIWTGDCRKLILDGQSGMCHRRRPFLPCGDSLAGNGGNCLTSCRDSFSESPTSKIHPLQVLQNAVDKFLFFLLFFCCYATTAMPRLLSSPARSGSEWVFSSFLRGVFRQDSGVTTSLCNTKIISFMSLLGGRKKLSLMSYGVWRKVRTCKPYKALKAHNSSSSLGSRICQRRSIEPANNTELTILRRTIVEITQWISIFEMNLSFTVKNRANQSINLYGVWSSAQGYLQLWLFLSLMLFLYTADPIV